MYMGNFWKQVSGKFDATMANELFPTAVAAMDDDDLNPADFEFAEDVLPNLGPGGETDEGDLANLSHDDHEPTGPTVAGVKALMCYPKTGIDELYVWKPEKKMWLLWNY